VHDLANGKKIGATVPIARRMPAKQASDQQERILRVQPLPDSFVNLDRLATTPEKQGERNKKPQRPGR
jgi:hypothetical protein